ncbi:hypothetical protein [Sporosarcina sp. NPDC096371]|uniref:hypothetical protein n=1 Tax=Sporosarcina sp. NPDC096371 TaxID=3364530 RepID=UPI00382BEB67
MNKRRIAVASVVVVFIGAVSIMLGMNRSDKLGLVIGQEEILQEEFLQAMSNEKYSVTQYFHNKYGAEVTKDFWLKDFEGESPYQMVADQTVDALTATQAVYEIAKDKGHLETMGYSDLLERYELENKTRETKISNGEPVYGLAQFTLDLYKEYEMNTLEKLYTNELDNEGMDISDEVGKQYYEENKEKLYVKNDDMEIEFIRAYYGILDVDESEIKALRDDLQSLSKEMSDVTTIGDLVDTYENLKPYYQHLTITSEEFSSRGREIGDVLELAMELESGEMTHVIDQNDSLYLIRSIDRVHHDYLAYEEVKDNILKVLREQKYEEIVAKRAEELSVSDDREKLYSFTKKHLR